MRYPDALQADLVAHGVAQRLGPLLRHPLGHRDGGDASRLRAEDVDDLVGRAAQRGVQDELWDLSGLTAPGERPHVQSLILSYSYLSLKFRFISKRKPCFNEPSLCCRK